MHHLCAGTNQRIARKCKAVIQLGMNRTVGRLRDQETPASATMVEKEHVIEILL